MKRMLAPRDLLAKFPDSPGVLPPGTVMFCGTLPVLGEIAGGEASRSNCSILSATQGLRHEYRVRSLPIAES